MQNDHINYIPVATPNTVQPPQPQPHQNRTKYLIISLIGIVFILAIVLIVVLLINNQDNNLPRNNTSTLQLYAALPEEASTSELQKIITDFDDTAKIQYSTYGTGTITIPGNQDQILFDYEVGETPTLVYGITYSNEDGELGYSISYSEDDETYQISSMYDVYDFKTKQEAIDAYLAPRLIQSDDQ